MRIGEIQTATVGDVTLGFRLSWGDAKRIRRDAQDVLHSDEPDAEPAFAEETLLRHLVSVDGLQDEEGQPISKLTREIVEALPPAFVQAAVGAMLEAGAGRYEIDAAGNG